MKTVTGKAAILRSIIVTILVIAFFIGIILTAYSMLYAANREIIIRNGESSAKESAERFEDYLMTSINAIKLSAYTIDGMMTENVPNSGILDYLVDQTVAIKSAVFENTSGLYGYINGEFLDGLMWVPPEDFVATERPWYIKAKEKNGEVTMVEPYLDVRTGTVLMAISKLLSDGVSVVSMDISLDVIQSITEESVVFGKSDMQMIIDRTGYVVAHSDRGEVGKNYIGETGSLGAGIVSQLFAGGRNDEGFIELNHNSTHYIVYAAELQNDFLCLSVKDATAIFNPLMIMLVITVAVVSLVVVIISAIMMNSGRKQLVLEKLGKQLSASADIYISMHEIDFLNDTFTEIRNKVPELAAALGETHTHCQELIRAMVTKFVAPSSMEEALDFVDFSKVNARLKGRNTITTEWLSVDNKWRRSRYIVSDRTPAGIVARAMYLIEDIDAEKRERDLTLEAIKLMNAQVSSVANIYFSMYDVDLLNDVLHEIKTHTVHITDVVANTVGNAQQYMYNAVERITSESSWETMREFVNFATLDERFIESNTITEEFLSNDNVWCRARFVISKCSEDRKLEHVLWLVASIDEEKRKRDSLSEAAQTLNYRVSSISNIYMTVHEIDIMNDTFTEIKDSVGYVQDIMGDIRTCAQETLRNIMMTVTDESCIDDMSRFVDLSTLEKRLRRIDTVAIEYMNKEKLWRRGRFIVSRRGEKDRLTHVLWLVEDIHNEKMERDKLIDMSERAIAESEAKSSFLSNMSHEIRTPINAVLGMNEMILRECEDPNVLAYSNSIRTAGNTLLGIVNDILDFSKIEAGKMEIIPVEYDLSSVINDLVNMIQTKADDKGLRLILEISREIPKELYGDEVRIKQVITNLLTNAVKYTEKGSVTFCIGYETIPDDPESIILDIAVKDTGIGIKREDMKKLFSEFERIEEERNRKVEGTGLGMSITKRLLEMMGSSLQVESIYKLGSKFSFRLKQRVVKWDQLGDYETAYRESLSSVRKYHEKFRAPAANVLVVDDTPMNLVVFRSLLKQTGVKIDTAASGDEGLALSYRMKYDIIFLDHMMPKKDGITTLHEMRARPDDPNLETPMICLTANAISGAREKYLADGFDDYLTKPIDPDRLEEMLIEYLPKDKIQGAEDDGPDEDPEDCQEGGSVPVDESGLPECLLLTDELDTEKGISNNGSVEGYIEALQVYAEMIGGIADETEGYWKSGDLENTTIKIHAMKSTSRIIGATEIGELAQALEDAGKDGDAAKVGEHIDELFERCRTLGGILSPLVGYCDDTDIF